MEIKNRFMQLKELTIRNFKGIEKFVLTIDADDAWIYGDNGTGKTTIGDAVSWLLFDKDSSGLAKFEIKPLDSTGNYKGKVESEVEATFLNGSEVTLKKVFKEKWTKKRGSVEKEMTGHTTDYFVDGVPVKMKDYKAKVAEIAAEENLFRLLTSPGYFSEQLGWGKRREMLLDICGDLTDEDVINSVPELAKLPAILDGKTCDDYKKIIAASRKKINSDIENIPSRVDEVDRGKPELESTDISEFPAIISSLKDDLDSKNQEIATTKAGGMVAELNKKMAVVEASIQKLKTSHNDTIESLVGDTRERLNIEEGNLRQLKRNLDSLCGSHKASKETVSSKTSELVALRVAWVKINEEVFTEETCPTCRQILPEEQVKDATARFNLNKANRLEENNKQGGFAAKALDVAKKEVADFQEKIASIKKQVEGKESEITAILKKIKEKDTAAPDIEELAEYAELTITKENLEREIIEEESGSKDVLDRLKKEKQIIDDLIQNYNSKISLVEQTNKADERIEELKKEEKELAKKYEELEHHLYLVEMFIREKVSMLEQRINGKFSMVNFKLFAEQINGGLQEICEVTVDGVPYNSLNNGSRVASGIDIINTMSNYHHFHPMIFVDNRESVTVLPETEAQMINLVVSETDKELRIANQ